MVSSLLSQVLIVGWIRCCAVVFVSRLVDPIPYVFDVAGVDMFHEIAWLSAVVDVALDVVVRHVGASREEKMKSASIAEELVVDVEAVS